MIQHEILAKNLTVSKSSFNGIKELKVRLKTYEECQKILGENLNSAMGMVAGFKQHIQESSKDNILEYTIKYAYEAERDRYSLVKGLDPIVIISHPASRHSYIGCGFEGALFEIIDKNTFNGL